MMVATATKAPELAISAPEAVALTQAGVKVAELYNWAPSETAVAWSGLIIVCARVYGPRVAAFAHRRRVTASAKVVPLHGQEAASDQIQTDAGPVSPAE